MVDIKLQILSSALVNCLATKAIPKAEEFFIARR
jgi:hypothetical protein